MQSKMVEYAYPSSITAEKAGFGRTGCWFVAIYPTESASTRCDSKYFTLDKNLAKSYADSLAIPYNWMHYYLLNKNL